MALRFYQFLLVMFLMLFVIESMAQLIGVVVKVLPPYNYCTGFRMRIAGHHLLQKQSIL